MRRSTRATVSSATRAAPARFRASAHAAAGGTGGHHVVDQQDALPGHLPAPRARRAAAEGARPRSGGGPYCSDPPAQRVAHARRSGRASGMPVRRAISRASRSDWLNPLCHCRRQCSGTGVTRSNRSSRGSAAASRSAERPRQGLDPAVFVQMDQLPQHAFVGAEAIGRVKTAQAAAAQRAAAFAVEREMRSETASGN